MRVPSYSHLWIVAALACGPHGSPPRPPPPVRDAGAPPADAPVLAPDAAAMTHAPPKHLHEPCQKIDAAAERACLARGMEYGPMPKKCSGIQEPPELGESLSTECTCNNPGEAERMRLSCMTRGTQPPR